MSKQVTFRGVTPDERAVRDAWAMTGRLERHYGSLAHCNVVILRDGDGRWKPTRYRVTVHARARQLDRTVSADVSVCSENLQAALHGAFERTEHSLSNRYRRRQRRQRSLRAA